MSVSSAPTPYWSTTRNHISVQYTSQSSTTKLIDLGAKVVFIVWVGWLNLFSQYMYYWDFFFGGGGEGGVMDFFLCDRNNKDRNLSLPITKLNA